ncbi:DUF47 family protein [Candidatus Bipolaricaulota bacterium]|nr:DUF47 family protein [Candidatus Bipolaricaulota bacterium]
MGLWKRVSTLLFEQPPTFLFVEHGKKVCRASEYLLEVMEAFVKGEDISSLKAEVDRWEHEADQIKHQIRKKLPRSDLFLPMARGDLMDLLWQQDEIADKAQDAVHLLSLLPLSLPQDLRALWDRITAGLRGGQRAYCELVEHLERHLKGERQLAGRMRELLAEIGEEEHGVSTAEDRFVEAIYRQRDLDAFTKMHLVEVARTVGQVAGHMENAAGRICLLFLG